MDRASNLRRCYRILEDRVKTALRTNQTVSTLRDDALAFVTAVHEVSGCALELGLGLTRVSITIKVNDIFAIGELELITRNVREMIKSLDEAEDESIDPPTTSPPSLMLLNHTGKPGRPRIEIDPNILEVTLPVEQKTTVARLIGCSARTVRRRQLEVEKRTGASLTPSRSTMTDDELDAIVGGILEEFPHFGRSMLMGAMTFRGHNVPERRIRGSLDRVRGAPGRFFGSRPIHRRKYTVPAVNSLWHHDGQHGVSYSVLQVLSLRHSTPLPRVDSLENCHSRFY